MADLKHTAAEIDAAIYSVERGLVVLDNTDNVVTPGGVKPVSGGAVHAAMQGLMPATPSGDPMHYAYEDEGAVYNATTNKWSLYEIEMTPSEMRTSYRETMFFTKFMALADYRLAAPKPEIYRACSFVANIGASESSANSFQYSNIPSWKNMFRNNPKLKVINTFCSDPKYLFRVADIANAFIDCTNFIKLVYPINISLITDANKVSSAFSGCRNIEDVRLEKLRVSISFKDSPKLTSGMLQYIVENAANTSAITITVHRDVYNKLTDTANMDYHSVWALAQTKNIAFATV